MHFNFKKISAAVLSCAVMLTSSVGTFAINTVASENNGFTAEQIEASPIKPTLSISRINLTYEEAKANPVQTLSISIKGADKKYCATGIRVFVDKNVTLIKQQNDNYVTPGAAVSGLLVDSYKLLSDNGFFVSTVAATDAGKDGVMYTFQVKLPDNIKGGEKYNFDIRYGENDICGDLFTNADDDENGKLMQAWIFTKGIEGGYITIEAPASTTTSTTTTSTTTSKTTTSTTSTSTTTSKTTTSTSKTTTSTSKTTTSSTKTSTTTSKTTTSSTTSTTTTTAVPTNKDACGDVDHDGKVSAYDASLTLTEYVNRSSGKGTFTEREVAIADVNKDSKIAADDASYILTYYNYRASQGTETDMAKWMYDNFLKK